MPITMKPTLRLLRQATGKGLRQVAAECGVTPKTVLAWENGAAPPTIDHAEAHARALGISIEDYNRLWREARQARAARNGTETP